MGIEQTKFNLSGKVIKGYNIHEPISRGRFGTIYHASQPRVNREVAIKVIEPQYANHPEFVRNFEIEAQLVARLEHIHIVPLYDYWREPDRAFLVMRWLRGGSLRESLIANGPWSLKATAQLLDQVASALALAHRSGVIHRDIKPDNILLDEENNALLTDFGVATTIVPGETAKSQVTAAGTPAYMAPELFMGQPATVRTDIYALGIMLYEMLTNTRPFPEKTTEELAYQHISVPIPSLQSTGLDLPHELNPVIWRATAKTPRARFTDVLELASAFRSAALSQTVPAPEKSAHPNAGGMLDTPETLVLDHPFLQENPYKGLRPFEQADAADFFGRDALIAHLIARLSEVESRFLALVGPSGSGKSSVVKAGLIPALRAGRWATFQNWFTVEMVPGQEPFRELEAALQRIAVNPVDDISGQLATNQSSLVDIVERILPQDPPTQLLLVIDQFEEMFTQTVSEQERRQFLACVSEAVNRSPGRLHVIVTLRADFYDRPLLYEGFGALMRESSEVILSLTAQELKLAIEKPAERLGLVVEPELVTAMIADVSQQPGALPLLQYALTEVFEHREGHVLTLDVYRSVGGIAGALARRAEEIYSDLDSDSQELTRQMFLRLVSLEEDAEARRRRLNWPELTTLSDNQTRIGHIRDIFVRARLLTTDRDPKTREPTVEVAHEALLREWQRLVDWLNSSREDIRMQRRLHVVAAEWQEAGKHPSYLLTSTRLVQFEEWAAAANLQLTKDEREFLNESIKAHTAREAAERARLEREKILERRTRNRLMILGIVSTTAAVIGLLLARFALDQREKAEQHLRELQILSTTDQAALALESNDPELALALFSSITEPLDSLPIQTRQMYYRAAYTPGTRLWLTQHNDAVISVEYSPDGQLAASGSGRIDPFGPNIDNALSIWNPLTGEELFHLTEAEGGHSDALTGIDFSPDGRLLASGSADKTIILWDVETGTVVRRLEGHQDWVVRVAFTPDGQQLLSTSGNFLLTALPLPSLTSDASVRLWDVTTGKEIRRFGGEDGGHQVPVMSLDISPDGQYAVTGDSDGIIILWDMATGTEIRRMESPGDWVSNLAFTLDGAGIFSALGKPSIGGIGEASTVLALWDTKTGARVRDYVGHTNVVIDVIPLPDGRRVLTGSADASLRLWDIDSGIELRRFFGHDDWIFGIAISPDAQHAVSASVDHTLRVWDIEPGNLLQRFDTTNNTPAHTADLSRDGTLALSGHPDGAIILWDAATGQPIRHFETSPGVFIHTVALSPDKRYAASGDENGLLTVWDVATGTALQTFTGHTSPILDVGFSPDGKRIVTASGQPERSISDGDYSVRIWDLATGEEVTRYTGHDNTVWSASFNPDGQRIVSGSSPLLGTGNRTIWVWEAASGKEIARLDGHTDLIGTTAFGPNGQWVLSGANDNTVRLWDASTGKEIRQFEGHTGFVNKVLLNPDERIAISGSDDDTVRLWDTTTGEEIYRIDDHQDTIQDMAVSADGRHLLILSSDGDMRLWRIDRTLDELSLWLATNRYVRDLTCVERANFRIEPLCEE